MLVATVTLLPTSSTCQGTTQVTEITTAMPTLVTTSGAPSTTPWRGTSTPSPPPSTLAAAATQAVKRPLALQAEANSTKERTFIMIKPDGVQRGLVGDVIKRFEQKGFKLV